MLLQGEIEGHELTCEHGMEVWTTGRQDQSMDGYGFISHFQYHITKKFLLSHQVHGKERVNGMVVCMV